jgi:hypothetical protein
MIERTNILTGEFRRRVERLGLDAETMKKLNDAIKEAHEELPVCNVLQMMNAITSSGI